jgi:hypothetical protein
VQACDPRAAQARSTLLWVSDVAACLALAVTMVEEQDRPGLQAFAHRELDRFIAERIGENAQDEPE